jgi:hypothetical protein
MGYKTRAIELRRFSKSKSEHLPKAQSQLSAGGVSAPYHKQRAMLHLPEAQSQLSTGGISARYQVQRAMLHLPKAQS